MNQQPAEGVMLYEETVHGFHVSRTKITTAHAAEALGRAVGEYVILHTGRLRRLESPRIIRFAEDL